MEAADGDSSDVDTPDVDVDTWGTLEVDITHSIDVTDYLGLKRSALRAHASQIAEESFWLSMDDDAFATAFGHEWFVDHRTARVDGEPFRTNIWSDVNSGADNSVPCQATFASLERTSLTAGPTGQPRR